MLAVMTPLSRRSCHSVRWLWHGLMTGGLDPETVPAWHTSTSFCQVVSHGIGTLRPRAGSSWPCSTDIQNKLGRFVRPAAGLATTWRRGRPMLAMALTAAWRASKSAYTRVVCQ